jgi:hypothetical protein
MRSYTFEIISRDNNQDGLFNLFTRTIVDNKVNKIRDIVLEQEEGRLDLVCKRLLGSKSYIEEMMMINNIINPFSIKSGDIIYYVSSIDLISLQYKDKEEESVNGEEVTNPKKGTRKDPTRQKGVPPTIRPVDFKQVIVDKVNKTLKLNSKLK